MAVGARHIQVLLRGEKIRCTKNREQRQDQPIKMNAHERPYLLRTGK
jgi:hypothetical protein